MLFDRICRDNGIRHLLTAPRSPTTTGKVERWHKTLRREFLDGKVFAIDRRRPGQLDAWVREYNYERPHQSLGTARRSNGSSSPQRHDRGRRAAWNRHRCRSVPAAGDHAAGRRQAATISFAAAATRSGRWLAGEAVEVVCEGGLVQITTAACSSPPTPGGTPGGHASGQRSGRGLDRPAPPTVGAPVQRMVD